MKYIRRILLLFIIFLSFINKTYALENIDVQSKNAILYNLKDDKVIYEKSPDDRVNIASLTKIMTALVAIENIDDYNKQIIITRKMLENLPNDLSKVGFKVGEVVTYNDLIYGILLKSGADATNSVAISVSGNIDEFVKLMNKKAAELDMNNSSFSNTIGIEGDNHYSTARDISKLLKYAIKNEKFLNVFTTKHYNSTNGEHKMNGPLKRIEESELDMTYVKGAKTGYTSKAGLCLASIAKYKKIDYLLVTLGAPYENKKQHFEDSKKIYEYFFDNYNYKTILSKGENITSIKTVYGKEYDIKSDKNYKSYLKNSIENTDLDKEYVGKTILDKKVKKGTKIGTYYIKYKGEILYSKKILSPCDVTFDFLFFIENNFILFNLFFIVLILIMIIRIKRK